MTPAEDCSIRARRRRPRRPWQSRLDSTFVGAASDDELRTWLGEGWRRPRGWSRPTASRHLDLAERAWRGRASVRPERGDHGLLERAVPGSRHESPGHPQGRAEEGVLPGPAAAPTPAQIALRRAFSRVQAKSEFPRWPVEASLHDLYDLLFDELRELAGGPVPTIAPWPGGRRWALVLTHDVETAVGAANIGLLREDRDRAGLPLELELRPASLRRGRRAGRRSSPRTASRSACTGSSTTDGISSRSRRSSGACPRSGATQSAGTRRLPLPGDPSAVGVDAAARLRLRLLVSRHRPIRAPGGRLLQLAAIHQRRSGGAPDHAAAGPHAVHDPARRGRAALAREGDVPARSRWDGADDHPSGLHARAALPGCVRAVARRARE